MTDPLGILTGLESRLDNLVEMASYRVKYAIENGVPVNGHLTKDKGKIAEYYGIGIHYVNNVHKTHLLGTWRMSPIQVAMRVMGK
jgi:hypothetical protein